MVIGLDDDRQAHALAFDHSAPAEVFVRRAAKGRTSLAYHRFATATEAISFVMDEIPSNRRAGVVMEVLDRRFDQRAIENLARTLSEAEA